jgi:hypothetical protein
MATAARRVQRGARLSHLGLSHLSREVIRMQNESANAVRMQVAVEEFMENVMPARFKGRHGYGISTEGGRSEQNG